MVLNSLITFKSTQRFRLLSSRFTKAKLHNTRDNSVTVKTSVESNASDFIQGNPDYEKCHSMWISMLFKDLNVRPINDIKSTEGVACIIDDPVITMINPYIDEKVLQTALGQISSILKIIPSKRAKPLGMIVRGAGGGKTRLLEEIRRAENRIESHLAVAVTFNNNSPYNVDAESFTTNKSFNIMLSMMFRIISVVYDISRRDAELRIGSTVSRVTFPQLHTIYRQ